MNALSLAREPQAQSAKRHELFEEIAREVEFFMKTAAGRIVQFGNFAKEAVRTAAIHLSKTPIITGPISGLRFPTNFRQKNRVLRKEIVCQNSTTSISRTAHQ